jgi:hypothetical protein
MADDMPRTSDGPLNAACWGGAAAAALGRPELGVEAGVPAGYLSTCSEQVVAQVYDVMSTILGRRNDRAVRVLADAAKCVGLEPAELRRRIEADPERE